MDMNQSPSLLRIDDHDKRAQHDALVAGYEFIETLHTFEMKLPTSSIIIRPLRFYDRESVIKIGLQELRYSRLYADPLISFEDAQNAYRERIAYAFENWKTFVAVKESAIAGFASLDKNEIELIAVDATHQKMGIGTMLIKRCAEECTMTHYNQMKVKTHRINVGAQAFYRSLGFNCTKIQHDYHKHEV